MELRDYQNAAVDGLQKNFMKGVIWQVLSSPTGSGKCHPFGTEVLMFDGSLKRVEDIDVGDLLMGPDSRSREVLKSGSGFGDLYTIIPKRYGRDFGCNLDHVLTLVRTNDKSGASGRVVDISLRDYFEKSNYFKHTHKLVRPHRIDFDAPKEFSVDPYLLGVILGDGTIANGLVSVTTNDSEIVDALKELSPTKVVPYSYENRCPSYGLTLGMTGGKLNPLTNEFRCMGLMGANSHTKFIPESYKTGSYKQRLSLLAGLIDTDGSLQGGYFDYCSVSKQLAKDFAFVARSCGFGASESYRKKTAAYRVSVCGHVDKIPTRIPRKQASKRVINKNILRTGFTVEKSGKGSWYGFELSGDGRYMLSDFTITHNTEIAMKIVSLMMEQDKYCEFICDRRNLVKQTSQRFEDAGIKHGILMGNDTRDVMEKVRISSAQTIESRGLARHRYYGLFDAPEEFYSDLYIVDEGHIIRENLFEMLKKSGAFVILMTATPFPAKLGEYCEEMVNVRTTRELISDGFLSGLQVQTVEPEREVNVEGLKSVGGEWAASEVSKRILHIVGEVVPEWELRCQERFGKKEQTIVFAASINDAEAICKKFTDAGYDFRVVSSRETDEHNAEIIDGFRNNEFIGIVNCAMLSRGMDFPSAVILVDCYPLRSSFTELIQRYGRIMRTAEGKLYGLIIDPSGNWMGFYDQIHMFYAFGPPDLKDPKLSKVVRRKKRKNEKQHHPRRVCRQCGLAFSPGDTSCKGCGAKRPAFKPPSVENVRVVDGKLEMTDEITGETMNHNVDLWREVCTAIFSSCNGDVEKAVRRAVPTYKALTGKWINREFDPYDRTPDNLVRQMVDRSFKAWITRQKAIEKSMKKEGVHA